MKFLRFCAKNSKYCDFLLFLIGIGSKTAIFTKILFVFLSPALCRQKWYRVFAKQRAKESEQTGKCAVSIHICFFILKICAKKGKIHFLWTVFLIFSKNNIFWNLKYFLWKCVSYLSKTICNSSCLTNDETFSNANKEIFVFKQSNRGQICCFKPICSALLVCYCFQSANNFKNTIERSFLWFKVVFVLKTLTYNKEQQSGNEKQIFAFFEDFQTKQRSLALQTEVCKAVIL